MDELTPSAQKLIQKLITLNPVTNKFQWDQLINQLWQLMESVENLQEKLLFLINLARQLSKTDIGEKGVRRQLVSCMIELMQESGKLWKTSSEFAGEAWLRTLKYVYNNLENYDHNRATVITWINDYYRWRVRDIEVKNNTPDPHIVIIDNNYNDDDEHNLIEQIPNPPESEIEPNLHIKIRQFVITDPELNTIHIKNYPEITAAKIILRRLPPEEIQWKDLAKEFNLGEPPKYASGVSTLSAFYQRKCRPRLIKYLISLGYESTTN